MQVGFDLQLGPTAEPRAVDLHVLHDTLNIVPRLGGRDLLDPVDRIDLWIARVAIALDPFDAVVAGIVAGESQVGAAATLSGTVWPVCLRARSFRC